MGHFLYNTCALSPIPNFINDMPEIFANNYTLTRLSASYIEANTERLFAAWIRVWKGSTWSEEEYFIKDESIAYISAISKISLSYILEYDSDIIAFVMASLQHFAKPKNIAEKHIQ